MRALSPTEPRLFGLQFPLARLIPAAILAASLGALGLALVAEHVYGLLPCPLCLYQRMPYTLAAAVALFALLAPPEKAALSAAIAAAAFLVGAGIAIYHVGVEQYWWESAACGGTVSGALGIEDLKAALARPAPQSCDAVPWSLFGISMAGYNVVAFLALAAASSAGALRLREAARVGAPVGSRP